MIATKFTLFTNMVPYFTLQLWNVSPIFLLWTWLLSATGRGEGGRQQLPLFSMTLIPELLFFCCLFFTDPLQCFNMRLFIYKSIFLNFCCLLLSCTPPLSCTMIASTIATFHWYIFPTFSKSIFPSTSSTLFFVFALSDSMTHSLVPETSQSWGNIFSHWVAEDA